MPEILVGVLSFVLVAAVFSGGVFVGWKLRGEKLRPSTPEELGMEERERLINEQKAFRDLLNYNAGMAYGITVVDEDAGGEG